MFVTANDLGKKSKSKSEIPNGVLTIFTLSVRESLIGRGPQLILLWQTTTLSNLQYICLRLAKALLA